MDPSLQPRIIAALTVLVIAQAACGHRPATVPPPTPASTPATGRAMPTSTLPVASAPASATPARTLADPAPVERIGPAELTPHLDALQRLADAHGGDRVTGSAGFDAATAYVAGVLEAAGYRVERRRFSLDGRTGSNLLAERPGASAETVMLGAHLDTVAGSPGLNDNGSGVAAVLAIAEALAELPTPQRTVRLAFWDAEEGGPLGSRAYVASLAPGERADVVAYLNLDMIGSPNGVRLIYDEAAAAPGSDRLTDRLVAALESHGLAWEPIDLEGDSDHGPFVAAGIPTGGLFSGGIEPVTDAQAARFGATADAPADACSHRPCDTLDNVDAGAAAELATAAARVLAEVAAEGPAG